MNLWAQSEISIFSVNGVKMWFWFDFPNDANRWDSYVQAGMYHAWPVIKLRNWLNADM